MKLSRALVSVSFFLSLARSVSAGSFGRAPTTFPDLYEASVTELQDGLERGDFTSVDLVKV